MKRLTKEALRARGIANTYGLLYAHGVLNSSYPFDRPRPPRVDGLPRPVPMIQFFPADRGRGGWWAYWAVTQPGVDLDPGAHWHYKDHRGGSRKAFQVNGRDEKQPQFDAAVAWAMDRFGITEWAREPFGSYVPKAFLDARMAQLAAFDPTAAVTS